MTLVVIVIGVAWAGLLLVAVGLCVSARDGDRALGFALDEPPAIAPASRLTAQTPPRVSM